jgi:N,N-dimethylformamidase
MGTLIAWILAFAFVLSAITGALWIQLFIRRRWHSRVSLPDPVAYTDAPSFRGDQEICLRIHSSALVNVVFSRCGGTGFVVAHTLQAGASLQSRSMSHWTGFDWEGSVTVPPNTLTAGFYRVDVTHQNDPSRQWSMLLIVKPTTPQPIIVVASTNTWNAYNHFGGLSNYRDRVTPLPLKLVRQIMNLLNLRVRIGDRHWLAAVPLPERRPNIAIHSDLVDTSGSASHLGRAETTLIRFLESENIPATVISDRDFAYDLHASEARLIVFNTHSEYWSEEMLGRLSEFIDRGISIAFLSGNNMYRKVQFLNVAISVIDQIVPSEQIVPLIGTYYDASGYGTFDAYRVLDANHWCLDGLAVQEGCEFGGGNAQRRGASGYETDKIRAGTHGFRTVAVGKNSEGPAFMVCRDLPNDGFVFTAGSVSFTSCLDDDEVIQGLVRNLVRRSLRTNRAKPVELSLQESTGGRR